MSWRFYGQSGPAPCGCRNGNPFLCTTSSLYTMTCLSTWTVWWVFWPKRRLNEWKTYSLPWSLGGKRCPNSISEVTPTSAMLLISAHILDCFQKLQSFTQWGKGMDNHPEDETSYTTKYQEAFLMYVENKYCATHWQLPVTNPETIPDNNVISSAIASRSGQSSYDPYDVSSDDGEYLMPNTVAKTTPGQSDPAPLLLTAGRLYLNSPCELPPNRGRKIRILMITTLTEWRLYQQNVKRFECRNSITQLFWTATPILPETSRRSQTGWMQTICFWGILRVLQVLLNASEVAEQNTRIFWRVWSRLQNGLKSFL